jgi:hypothetical protein
MLHLLDCLMVGMLLLVACAPTPAGVGPTADFAVQEPCRFKGTSHRDARERIEVLRGCGAIDEAEWACLSEAAKSVDRDVTALCRSAPVSSSDLVARQRAAFLACVEPRQSKLAECAVFSSDTRCLQNRCG